MTQELYINGESLDLATDTQVTLNFKSNILGAIDKIVASNSQTIRVPKTTRNRRILDNPTAPAYSSRYRYKRLPCRYLQNGIELVNGYAVLLDSAEEYELAMYWGVMTQFQEWLDAAPSLRDIKTCPVVSWDDSNEVNTYTQVTEDGYGFASYNNGITKPKANGILENTDKTNIFPSVTVEWLLERIQEDSGISFMFPDRFDEVFRNLAVPCVDRNAGEEAWESSRYVGDVNLLKTQYRKNTEVLYSLEQTRNVSDRAELFAGNIDVLLELPGGGYYEYRYSLYDVSAYDWVTVRFTDKTKNRYTKDSGFRVQLLDERNDSVRFVYFPAKKDAVGNYYIEVDSRFDVEDFTRFRLEVFAPPSVGSFALDQALEIVVPFDEMEFDTDVDYSIVPNLPDIEQIKFVNAICEMFGLYAMGDATDPKVIRFVSLEDLVSMKAEAVDWSDKLMLSAGSEPKEVQFSMGDYAQKNIFRYNEDEDVKETGEGVITLPNESLNPEEEIVSLPFSASDGAKIVQWEYNDDKTKVTFVNSSPRIMNLYADRNGYASLTFRGLSFEDLLPKYYNTLSDLLNEVVVIKENLRLNEVDLKAIDYERPVYLRQYGRYYGIREIQAKGEESEVELVQLRAMISDNAIRCNIDYEVVNESAGNKTYGFVLNLDAQHPIASTIDVEVEYSSGVATDRVTVAFEAGDSGSTTEINAESAYNARIASINPSADAVYRYKEAQLEPFSIKPTLTPDKSNLYFRIEKAPASDVFITWKYLDIDGEAMSTHTSLASASDKTALTRNFGGIEIVGVSPSHDDKYNYIVEDFIMNE